MIISLERSNVYSFETLARLSELRAKVVADPNSLTLEESKEVIRLMREGRMRAHEASDASRRKKAKEVVVSGEDLLADLMK
jgi:hypothetical protein